jgi:glycine cleavage system H protein
MVPVPGWALPISRTFVELPAVGSSLVRGGSASVIDSVKAASDVYAPVGGVVTAINAALEDAPDLVNSAPESDGWLWDMALANPGELTDLLDAAEYADLVGGL